MLTPEDFAAAQERARCYFARAGIVLTPEEAGNIEVADFGLSDLDQQGLVLVTYVNTERVCAKELVLFPRQTCPEHRHPPVAGEPGKEETFRCRWGEVFLYVPGSPSSGAGARPPAGSADHYTAFREVRLRPGDQYTIPPDTLHWFQAGDEGAVVSEFSTRSRDEFDVFTDPAVARATTVGPPRSP
jgi:D-lyxose ketol-isomerase